ncbi:MAG: nucleotide exchange factor GrpE [Bacteroidales bacterium]|nr:nucleotide exchange factor GrpE [Bacteroidales bacterium]HPD94992.1 nucleotide exchange factor GrpE [Tenuifilaceae bacterium]HRX30465.1 nucleotide exchange factor GrpE [Tenuifilaceae bacterium]
MVKKTKQSEEINDKEEVTSEKEEKIVDETLNEEKKEEQNEKNADATSSETEEIAKDIETELGNMKDKYLRLSAEFDNYRKRTLKEKSDLLKYASEDVLTDLLPVVDDLDRALNAIEEAKDVAAVKEGLKLIVNKFHDFLKSKGIKEIDAMGKDLDTDLHEAVTKIPAPDDKSKGKIVDVIQKGYLLNDKVVRFSKVVIGE